MNDNKFNKSVLNLATSSSMILGSVLKVVVANYMIETFGSELNGIIASVSYIVMLLTVLEAGLTIAVNTTLYAPFLKSQYHIINPIMGAARKTLFLVGCLLFTLVCIIGLIYPQIVTTDISGGLIFYLFITTGLGTFFYIGFTLQYSIMFQVSQREFVTSAVTSITDIIAQTIVILLIIYTKNIYIIQFLLLLMIIIKGLMIYFFFKKSFPKVDFSGIKDYSAVKKSKDIFMQKVAGMIYSTTSLILITIFINPTVASVYFVLISIFAIFKGVVNAFISAPINGLGQVFSLNLGKREGSLFIRYQFVIFIIITFVLCVLLITLRPFLMIYAADFDNALYYDKTLVILFVFLCYTELFHIPSGSIINVTGNYILTKKTFIVFSIINLVLATIFIQFFGVNGVLIAGIISNLYLGGVEVFFAHFVIFKNIFIQFLKILSISFVLLISTFLFGLYFEIEATNYLNLFFYTFTTAMVIIIIVVALYYTLLGNVFKEVKDDILTFINRKKIN